MKTILHTESSPGWGGQEIRILKEALGMRERGYHVILAVKSTVLAKKGREEGLVVYKMAFSWRKAVFDALKLAWILYKHSVDIVNTHSSKDSWIAGIVAKSLGKRVIRTRHLSTPVKGGVNGRLLYRWIPHAVVTTCQQSAEVLQRSIGVKHCISIPTGVDPIHVDQEEVERFKRFFHLQHDHIVVGSLCIMRWWKGIDDMLQAAALLKCDYPLLRWVIIGDGVSYLRFLERARELNVEDRVIFTGFLNPPYPALAALDVFILLSHDHEGVSQASLQAALLGKPLITTPIGGLPEVCIHQYSGLLVPVHAPREVADAVAQLIENPSLRQCLGSHAQELVTNQFTFIHTLDSMERMYFLRK